MQFFAIQMLENEPRRLVGPFIGENYACDWIAEQESDDSGRSYWQVLASEEP